MWQRSLGQKVIQNSIFGVKIYNKKPNHFGYSKQFPFSNFLEYLLEMCQLYCFTPPFIDNIDLVIVKLADRNTGNHFPICLQSGATYNCVLNVSKGCVIIIFYYIRNLAKQVFNWGKLMESDYPLFLLSSDLCLVLSMMRSLTVAIVFKLTVGLVIEMAP